ncbi:hypothetical protein IIO_04781 [Bacillus cereus VD115]|nr:hypothetical protein IIO_04781 [Bacillus cereus VD115]
MKIKKITYIATMIDIEDRETFDYISEISS